MVLVLFCIFSSQSQLFYLAETTRVGSSTSLSCVESMAGIFTLLTSHDESNIAFDDSLLLPSSFLFALA